MKLKRSAHLLFVDASMGGSTVSWFLVGKNIEELSVDLGADVETVKNILDESVTNLNGFEPQISADPYYANPDDAIYEPLKACAMDRVMDEAHCKTKFLEVVVEDTADTSHDAWQQDCYLVPDSIGGDTSGLQIPFSIYPDGERTKGTATLSASKVPTFTAATAVTTNP